MPAVTVTIQGHASSGGKLYPSFDAVSRPDGDVTVVQQAWLKDTMAAARDRLIKAVSYLADNDVKKNPPDALKKYYKIYFRLTDTEMGALGKVHDFVVENLTKMKNGLLSDDLAIVDNADKKFGHSMTGVAGYVRMSKWEIFHKRDPSRPVEFAGRIHLDWDLFRVAVQDSYGNELSEEKVSVLRDKKVGYMAATLIHEASHKFTGTRDWSYLPNDTSADLVAYWDYFVSTAGENMAAQMHKDNAYFKMTPEQAQNNADSYGGFAYNVPTD
jgi:hypothetical protein